MHDQVLLQLNRFFEGSMQSGGATRDSVRSDHPRVGGEEVIEESGRDREIQH